LPKPRTESLEAENARLKTEVERLGAFRTHTIIPNEILQAENARLKAEVERLTAFTTRTFIPNEELQAEVARLKEQVERLTKAGDAMAKLLFIEPSYIGSPKQEAVVQWCKLTDDKPYA
jgi:uncharacterized small protein (DUF1192 family)